MRNDTRKKFNHYIAEVARINGVTSADTTFTVDPTPAQKLEEKIQRLSHAISKQNKQEMGNALTEDMIPFLEK